MQILGLAYIYDIAFGVIISIYSGRMRKKLYFLTYIQLGAKDTIKIRKAAPYRI